MGRLFTDEVLTEMGKNNARPIIMPMSNPVSNMECSHARAQRFTGAPPSAPLYVDGRGDSVDMGLWASLVMEACVCQTEHD